VERVLRLVDAAEYKRRQYPPGPKVSERNFGRDRRLPITSAWREPAPREPAPPEPAPSEPAPPEPVAREPAPHEPAAPQEPAPRVDG
jgi:NAD+ synthase (glutamine-hydrolysing)